MRTPSSKTVDLSASLAVIIKCSGIFSPSMFSHAGIADWGRLIQKLGLFHCVKDFSGIATAA